MTLATTDARFIGAAATRALYAELTLEPKPGLISLRDNGSHRDMDAGTFMRSLFALRHYFPRMVQAGQQCAPLTVLVQLGVQAERRMLAATGGVNTHRGAVFCLGLLCAAAGCLSARGWPFGVAGLRGMLLEHWGESLRTRARAVRAGTSDSHGERAARQYRLRSAGDEAAEAFPTLFEVAIPTLQRALHAGWSHRQARVQALFATMAVLDDTNLVHRGGVEGLRFTRHAASEFLAAGGAGCPDWIDRARAIHYSLVVRNLSPGGSADLLGGACWVHLVCKSWRRNPDNPHAACDVRTAR